jgi:hypothetical protein
VCRSRAASRNGRPGRSESRMSQAGIAEESRFVTRTVLRHRAGRAHTDDGWHEAEACQRLNARLDDQRVSSFRASTPKRLRGKPGRGPARCRPGLCCVGIVRGRLGGRPVARSGRGGVRPRRLPSLKPPLGCAGRSARSSQPSSRRAALPPTDEARSAGAGARVVIPRSSRTVSQAARSKLSTSRIATWESPAALVW